MMLHADRRTRDDERPDGWRRLRLGGDVTTATATATAARWRNRCAMDAIPSIQDTPMSRSPVSEEVLMSRELEQSRPAADDATARTARRSLQCKLFGIVSKPETLGRYELVGRIGEGAWGAVHEARNPLLDRRVALKVMKNDPSDPQHREDRSHALRKEASTLAKLSHPNLVKVYDAGQADGRAYVA